MRSNNPRLAPRSIALVPHLSHSHTFHPPPLGNDYMPPFRKYSRRERNATRKHLFLAASFGLLLFLFWFALRPHFFHSSSYLRCQASSDPATAVAPDYMFISLVNPSAAFQSLDGLSKLNVGSNTCVYRIYVTEDQHFEKLSAYHAICIAQGRGCAVEVHLHRGARMWGDLSLRDVAKNTRVVFLRDSLTFTSRALTWFRLAHRFTDTFYASGGRHDISGFAIGCHGELPLYPSWAHHVGSFNTTCAFSPIRSPGPDTWEFFTHWFVNRRREWSSWPHAWNKLESLPTFWKGKNKNARDSRLVEFGEDVGKDYSYASNRYLVWEHWYARWASNYTMRVLTAETNLDISTDTLWKPPRRVPFQRKQLNDTANGIVATTYGDALNTGKVWSEALDGELGAGYFNALKKIVAEKPTMVSLTIVNYQFMQLTRSWLCNVQAGNFLPPNIIWITLDKESKQELDALDIGQTVDVMDALSAHNMDSQHILYGQPAYWKLMLMRTRLIRDILDRGIDVFLFETDQVWLQNPFDYINKELEAGSDMVGTLDTQHNVAGNTIMLRSILPTRRMWSEVYRLFKMSYDSKRIEEMDIHSSTFVQHDQYHLSNLLLFDISFTQDFPVALGLLNAQLFVGGSWYSGMYNTTESRRPVIINNNFISGTEKKKARAISFGHWFLTSDNMTCDNSIVRKALQYDFARYPYSQTE